MRVFGDLAADRRCELRRRLLTVRWTRDAAHRQVKAVGDVHARDVDARIVLNLRQHVGLRVDDQPQLAVESGAVQRQRSTSQLAPPITRGEVHELEAAQLACNPRPQFAGVGQFGIQHLSSFDVALLLGQG